MDRACVREDADRRNVQTEDHTDLIHSDSLYKTVKVLLTSEKKNRLGKLFRVTNLHFLAKSNLYFEGIVFLIEVCNTNSGKNCNIWYYLCA